jgi:hypothetical protein
LEKRGLSDPLFAFLNAVKRFAAVEEADIAITTWPPTYQAHIEAVLLIRDDLFSLTA